MDAEEIARLVRDLKVSGDTEENVVVISKEEAEKGHKRIEKTVVGKIFSRRVMTRELIRSNLPRILRSRGSTEIEVVGANLFVINFTLESDKKIALEEGPWHFFQDLMILKQPKAMQTPMEVVFDEISLWVQCHNVPLECMDSHIITRIGEQVGKVEEVDVGERGSCVGKFARVRVSRSISAPLVRYIPLKQEGLEKDVFVLLQYEKLPDFCFYCGRVGHISRDCGDVSVDKSVACYGSWLRAGRSFVGKRGGDGGSRSNDRSSEMGSSTDRWKSGPVGSEALHKGLLEGAGDSRLVLGEGETKGTGQELNRAASVDDFDVGSEEMEMLSPVGADVAPPGKVEGVGDRVFVGADVVPMRVGGSEVGGGEEGTRKSLAKALPRGGIPGQKGWKKLARVRKVGAEDICSSEEVGGLKEGPVKREMGFLRDDEDVDEEGHQVKIARTGPNFRSEVPTAVVAAQPRRTL